MKNTMTHKNFEFLFDNKKEIFFLQIGACDGISFDPLNKLIKKNNNWSGILFEPGKTAFEELKITYKDIPKLKFVNSAISNFDGKSTLYCGKTSAHFTLDKNKALDMFDITPIEIEIDVMSPKTVINKFNIKKIDLLQIDTEGRDFTIIKSFLEEGLLPEIIRFEWVNLSYEETNAESVIDYLSEYGYESFYVPDEGDIVSKLKIKKTNLTQKIINNFIQKWKN